MKRALIQNVKVMPYTLETAIDREGYLSAILAASVTAGTSAKVSATALVNFDIDLVGCKRYIKINVTGPTTATYAVALGDPVEAPV